MLFIQIKGGNLSHLNKQEISISGDFIAPNNINLSSSNTSILLHYN